MKPRIASYYDHRVAGRNDGNPLYVSQTLRTHYRDVVDYDHLIPDPGAFHDVYTGYALHLWMDWAEDALFNHGILPYKPIPCPHPGLYWASDTHLGYEYRKEKAKQFDWVMVAQRPAVEQFKADGVPWVEWMPHAVEPDVYNPLGTYTRTPELREAARAATTLPSYDVAFVGYLTFPARIDFLDAVYKGLAAQGRTYWHASRFFEDAARIFTRARVVLNHAVRGDVNMRVFEALATRSLLVTPDVPGLTDLFTDGVHLVTYKDGDVADALAKLEYYTDDAHADERERIAAAGYAEVLAKHTFRHRVARMLELAGIVG
jgi:hypothetical protein